MIERECPTCGQMFRANPKKPQQVYCSRECWRLSRFRQVERTCETCGKTFSVYQARGAARFCSWECRRSQVKKSCEFCGEPFYVKRSDAHLRRTCSRRCSASLRALEKRSPRQGQPKTEDERQRISEGLRRYYAGDPEKHWNYQGGEFSQKRGPSWAECRRLARERDSYACRICGVTEEELGKQLAVHHIIPFRRFQSHTEANRLENLICVCQSCHMKLEHGVIVPPAP